MLSATDNHFGRFFGRRVGFVRFSGSGCSFVLVVVDCCRWRFGLSPLAGGCGTLPEALGVHLKDGGVVDQTVDGGDGRTRLNCGVA